MPDLDDLDHFSQGLPPMTSLPPSEVRRRGDRLRRRNTGLAVAGGVLAAAVAIGTPVVALSGGDGGSDIQPAPSPSQTETPRTWVTAIPADFPLADGFPETNGDGTPTQVAGGGTWFALTACGTDLMPSDGVADLQLLTYTGESEDTAYRVIALYPDADSARTALAAVRDGIAGCASEDLGNGSTMERAPLTLDLGTEESYVLTEQVTEADGLVTGATVTLVGRSGNAVYLTSSYGAVGGDQVVTAEAERLRDESSVPLAALCAFASDPCE